MNICFWGLPNNIPINMSLQVGGTFSIHAFTGLMLHLYLVIVLSCHFLYWTCHMFLLSFWFSSFACWNLFKAIIWGLSPLLPDEFVITSQPIILFAEKFSLFILTLSQSVSFIVCLFVVCFLGWAWQIKLNGESCVIFFFCYWLNSFFSSSKIYVLGTQPSSWYLPF